MEQLLLLVKSVHFTCTKVKLHLGLLVKHMSYVGESKSSSRLFEYLPVL